MQGKENYKLVRRNLKEKFEKYRIRLSDGLRSFMMVNLNDLTSPQTSMQTNEILFADSQSKYENYVVTYEGSEEEIQCLPTSRENLFAHIDEHELMRFIIRNYRERVYDGEETFEIYTTCIKETLNSSGFVYEEYNQDKETIEAETYSREKCDMVIGGLKQYNRFEKAVVNSIRWNFFFKYYGSKKPSTIVKAYIDVNDNIRIEERDYETNELLDTIEPIKSNNPSSNLYKEYYKYMVIQGYVYPKESNKAKEK